MLAYKHQDAVLHRSAKLGCVATKRCVLATSVSQTFTNHLVFLMHYAAFVTFSCFLVFFLSFSLVCVCIISRVLFSCGSWGLYLINEPTLCVIHTFAFSGSNASERKHEPLGKQAEATQAQNRGQ